MSRWWGTEHGFHISAGDSAGGGDGREENPYGADSIELEFDPAHPELFFVNLNGSIAGEKPWQDTPNCTRFIIWDYELVNFVEYLESHPMFAKMVEEHNSRYSGQVDAQYRLRSELEIEIQTLKAQNEALLEQNDGLKKLVPPFNYESGCALSPSDDKDTVAVVYLITDHCIIEGCGKATENGRNFCSECLAQMEEPHEREA